MRPTREHKREWHRFLIPFPEQMTPDGARVSSVMAATLAALWSDVLTHPGDDTPRGKLADFFDDTAEHLPSPAGARDRAELIRLGVEYDRRRDDLTTGPGATDCVEEWKKLSATATRVKDLAAGLYTGWPASFGNSWGLDTDVWVVKVGGATRPTVILRRGFPDEIRGPWFDLFDGGRYRWADVMPVRRVQVTGCYPDVRGGGPGWRMTHYTDCPFRRDDPSSVPSVAYGAWQERYGNKARKPAAPGAGMVDELADVMGYLFDLARDRHTGRLKRDDLTILLGPTAPPSDGPVPCYSLPEVLRVMRRSAVSSIPAGRIVGSCVACGGDRLLPGRDAGPMEFVPRVVECACTGLNNPAEAGAVPARVMTYVDRCRACGGWAMLGGSCDACESTGLTQQLADMP